MIKIEHPDLDKIAEKHMEACLLYVRPRLNFYIDLFKSLGYKVKVDRSVKSLCKYYGLLSDTTFLSLIDPFLRSGKKCKNKKYNIGINEVRSVLTSKQNSIMDDVNNLDKFKRLHDFFVEVQTNLHSIIKSTPHEINEIIKSEKYKLQKGKLYKEAIEKSFSYSTLTGGGFKLMDGTKWDNYALTLALDISVCPYCNRNWINTVENGVYKNKKGQPRRKVTNPQLDHFFSKSDFPLFRLSIYNLIPSCETCNARLKKDIEFDYEKQLHPYSNGYGANVRFSTEAKDLESFWGLSNNYSIQLDYYEESDVELLKKVESNHEIFEIDTIYKEHSDIISEVYLKRSISNEKYMEMMQKQFPDAKLTKKELYRLAFGNYYDEADFKRRPFAKLTKDIAKQLRLIKE